MPYKIRIVADPDGYEGYEQLVPGDMFFRDPGDAEDRADIGQNYRTLYAGQRALIYVKLPNGSIFCPDKMAFTRELGYHGNGWLVSGEAPNITVQPSINIVGYYHGWITNGVIGDDLEGRAEAHAEKWRNLDASR